MDGQYLMFGNPETLPYQAHSATSRAAADGMRESAKTDREAVLMVIQQSIRGLTDEEIQRRIKLNPSTERPRRIELVRDGKLRDSGRTRKTASGRLATIWEAV